MYNFLYHERVSLRRHGAANYHAISGALLFGYPRERRGEIVADDLNATALVLQSDSVIVALVSLDLCVIDEEETAKIREAASAATGIPPQNITIHTTHTHSGPATINTWGWGEKNSDYLVTREARSRRL